MSVLSVEVVCIVIPALVANGWLLSLPPTSLVGVVGLYRLMLLFVFCRCADVLNYKVGEDVLMGILPFFHIYGQTLVALAGLKNGACIVTQPAFSPELFLKTIKEYKVMCTFYIIKLYSCACEVYLLCRGRS